MKAKQNQRIPRKILFGKIHCGIDDSGQEIAFEAEKLLRALPRASNRRYQTVDGSVSLGSSWDGQASPYFFCLWNRRMAGLPQMERNGKFRDVPLEDEEGLAEKTHIVFFPDNVIGYEYNHHGPRVSRLDSYFHHLAPSIVKRFRVQTLVHPDVAERFESLGDLFSVDLKITRQYAEVLKNEGDALGSALAAASALGEFDTISITGSTNRRQGNIINRSMSSTFKRLMRQQDPGLDILKVKGQNSQEWLDMLKDQLAFEVQAVVEQTKASRSVNGPNMYRQIVEAYQANSAILEEAKLAQ